jgi:hypothetical protein
MCPALCVCVLCFDLQSSRSMTRSLSSMQEWQRQRDRKLEERRQAKEAAEAMSLRAAPVILKRSGAMVEAARRRQASARWGCVTRAAAGPLWMLGFVCVGREGGVPLVSIVEWTGGDCGLLGVCRVRSVWLRPRVT